jgi:hypothetical protein
MSSVELSQRGLDSLGDEEAGAFGSSAALASARRL